MEWLIKDELERIWEEAGVAEFKALFPHLPEGIWRNHEYRQTE